MYRLTLIISTFLFPLFAIGQNIGSSSNSFEENFDCTIPCPKLISETYQMFPKPRNRTTIGVGEEVEITLKKNRNNKCGAPQWVISSQPTGNNAILLNPMDASVTLVAGVLAGPVTVSAQFPSGNQCEQSCGQNFSVDITFDVILPSDVLFVTNLNISLPHPTIPGATVPAPPAIHNRCRPSSGHFALPVFAPGTVNFYNILTKELEAPPIFSNKIGDFWFHTNLITTIPNHPEDNWFENESGLYFTPLGSPVGTKSMALDIAQFEALCADVLDPSLYSGTLTYNIDWICKRNMPENGAPTISNYFITIAQEHSQNPIINTFKTEKNNAQSNASLFDPTTFFTLSNPCNLNQQCK